LEHLPALTWLWEISYQVHSSCCLLLFLLYIILYSMFWYMFYKNLSWCCNWFFTCDRDLLMIQSRANACAWCVGSGPYSIYMFACMCVCMCLSSFSLLPRGDFRYTTLSVNLIIQIKFPLHFSYIIKVTYRVAVDSVQSKKYAHYSKYKNNLNIMDKHLKNTILSASFFMGHSSLVSCICYQIAMGGHGLPKLHVLQWPVFASFNQNFRGSYRNNETHESGSNSYSNCLFTFLRHKSLVCFLIHQRSEYHKKFEENYQKYCMNWNKEISHLELKILQYYCKELKKWQQGKS